MGLNLETVKMGLNPTVLKPIYNSPNKTQVGKYHRAKISISIFLETLAQLTIFIGDYIFICSLTLHLKPNQDNPIIFSSASRIIQPPSLISQQTVNDSTAETHFPNLISSQTSLIIQYSLSLTLSSKTLLLI